ncbi:MAG TPA: hypothetical protein VF832_03640, partial [Longimicrobiales bacterium]
DEGWARYTFEQLGLPYTSIDKDDLRHGNLRQRFDVILLPSSGGSLEQQIQDVTTKFGPIAYERTKATPNLGTPASSPDITGGPGFPGLAGIQRFLEEGGVVLSMANATRLVAESGIARELEPHAAPTLFHPGSIVRAKALRPQHPLLYGYPDVTMIFRGNGPLYQVEERDRGMIVLEYGTKAAPKPDTGAMLGMQASPAHADTAARGHGDTGTGAATVAGKPASPGDAAKGDVAANAGDSASAGSRNPAISPTARDGSGAKADDYVVSGMVRNEGEIVGQGAIFDVPVGKGRVLAFTFNPLHRFLSRATFPMVWNALMNWNALPGIPPAVGTGEVAARQQ